MIKIPKASPSHYPHYCRPTHDKLHRVRVGELKWFVYNNVLGLGQLQWFRLDSAGERLTAGQLDLSPHYPTISELVLFTAFVVRDEEMNVVENVCGTLLT